MSQRVLLVENDDDQRKLLSMLLREAGLVPVPAWNAEDGLAILDDCACDAAVFDIQLPGMDGLKALRLIAEKRPRLPVVLVTASGDVREREAQALGARGFLRKPFSAGEFVECIGAALAHGGAGPTSDV